MTTKHKFHCKVLEELRRHPLWNGSCLQLADSGNYITCGIIEKKAYVYAEELNQKDSTPEMKSMAEIFVRHCLSCE